MAEKRITLAAARVNAGLSQAELADHLGVDRTTVLRWEKGKGKIKLEYAAELCRLSRVSLDELIF